MQSVAFVKVRATEGNGGLVLSAEQIAPLFSTFCLKWIKVKRRDDYFVAEVELKDPNTVKSCIESLQGQTFQDDKFRIEKIDKKMIDIK